MQRRRTGGGAAGVARRRTHARRRRSPRSSGAQGQIVGSRGALGPSRLDHSLADGASGRRAIEPSVIGECWIEVMPGELRPGISAGERAAVRRVAAYLPTRPAPTDRWLWSQSSVGGPKAVTLDERGAPLDERARRSPRDGRPERLVPHARRLVFHGFLWQTVQVACYGCALSCVEQCVEPLSMRTSVFRGCRGLNSLSTQIEDPAELRFCTGSTTL